MGFLLTLDEWDMRFYNGRMKMRHIAWAALLTVAMQLCQANEEQMKRALKLWEQQDAEYRAALDVATTPEQRDSILPPSTGEVAEILWKAIRGSTGVRNVAVDSSGVRGRLNGEEPKKINTYEMDEEWAAPAVVWFLNHPESLVKIYEGKPQKLAIFAQALLNSVRYRHYASPLIGKACAKLAENNGADVYETLQKIYEHNTDPAARAAAALAMSVMLANPAMAGEEGGRARARAKRIYLIRQALVLAPQDEMFGAVSLTDAAQELIYRIHQLEEGAIPPRIKITDVRGNERLFPVVGKANLIFFWDPEEDVGLSIMRKQEALTTKYPQLELCPVVVHRDRDELQKTLLENGVDLCYMDDERGSAGQAYRVSQLPHAVLVNEHSRVLYSGYPDMQLQSALNAWQKEAENNAQPPANHRPTAPTGQSNGLLPPTKKSSPPLREMPQF